jgi:hypothetical protein
MKNIFDKLVELEEIAESRYLEGIEMCYILETLDEDEKKEYKKLYKKHFGVDCKDC